MKFTRSSLFAIATVLSCASAAQAQETPPVEALPEAIAEGDRVDEAYEMGTGNDSGTSTIKQKEIEARTPGSGDVNQLLKVLPSVQFMRNEGLAKPADIQDIRPADISISGGRIYENLVTINGVDVNSRMDVTESNAAKINEVAGNSAQTQWLDSELIGEIILRDSNISAEYGRFTGGALEIQTRDPKRRWGASATMSYTEDAMVNYIVSDGTRLSFEEDDEELPDAPEFSKWRFGATLDVPVSDRGGLLFGFNRSRSEVTYFKSARYGGGPVPRSSVSDNFLVGGTYDVAPDILLSGKVSYSPYESEYSSSTGLDKLVVSHGGGVAAQFGLESKANPLRWKVDAKFSHSDSSREAEPVHYSISSSTINGDFCSSSSCSRGGFGDLNQTQDNYNLAFRLEKDAGPGVLRGGVDFQHIDAMRERPETNYYYKITEIADNVVCVDGEDLTCANGEYYLYQQNELRAYRADIYITSLSAWGEYDASFGPVDLRAGIRYDHENFLGNHNIAPRLAVTWNLGNDWALTGGANRYYGRSMVGYAIKEQYPDSFIYRRVGTTVGDDLNVSNDDWYLYKTSRSTTYSQSNLDTPYSDELTASVGAKFLGGKLRLKGVYRDTKDEFARSVRFEEPYILENGNETTRRFYVMTNDGRSKYRGGSLEWVRTSGKHTFAFNVNYSKTSSNVLDYFVSTDDLLEDGEEVVYDGQIVNLLELLALNQRLEFASPLFVNASWSALWFDDRLTTNVNLRYRDGFEQIEDSGANETIDGTRYDVFDIIKYSDRVDVNLNASMDVIRSKMGTVTLDVRASNLLNLIPAQDSVRTSNPYQYGRSFWFGLKYKY